MPSASSCGAPTATSVPPEVRDQPKCASASGSGAARRAVLPPGPPYTT
ncbi:hypothetical protein [Streptosporangium sp. NPDC002524]